jgi:hypothetical protein
MFVRFAEARSLGFCADGRQQIDDKGEDVKCKNEGDDPLKNSGNVFVITPIGGDEDDGEDELDDDECELYPE